MSRSMYSADWYRVATFVPRLRSHAKIHRQTFRGDVWYVMQDQQGGRYHRLSPVGHLMLCLMDGRRTVQAIWNLLGERLGSEQPTQDECIALLSQLHSADLLAGDVAPDILELQYRSGKIRTRNLISRIRNPMAMRIPLFDPDDFLTHTLWIVGWIFSGLGALLWLSVVGTGVALVGIHWPELTSNLVDRLISAESLLLIVLIYPVIKAFHELGHGYAAKKWGGEVHEIGVMFLVLMPVPYVDASSSLAFRQKWRRALVGGAGILVELALAGLAMILWVNVEDGWIRAIAFNVMLIGGVSTLLFNGNPLLRFDGYYVLCDVVEIPNLGTRSNKYLLYLVQRYLFGVEDVESPVTASGERLWFPVYSIAAFVYRLFVMFGIAIFIASKLFFLGVLLAIWSVIQTMALPLFRGMKFVATSPRLRRSRARAMAVVGAIAVAVAMLLFVVPAPYSTLAEGVVWAPENTQIRTGADGEIAEVLVFPGERVVSGTPLVRLSNPDLDAQLRMLLARRDELRIQLEANLVNDRVGGELTRTQIGNVDGAIKRAREAVAELVVRATADGEVVLPGSEDLVGQYVQKGQQIGALKASDGAIVRVVVPQETVDLVRNRTQHTQVRFVSNLNRIFDARLISAAPSAVTTLPSETLSTRGGGRVLTSPDDGEGLRPLQTVFQFDLKLDRPNLDVPLGLRTMVRFDHGFEAIGWRIVRSARQLLLRVFSV